MAGRRARRARPARAPSQHFLHSRRLAAELVADACVGPDDLVVEVGAGTGLLTAELARVAGRVIAVELDANLAARLRGRFRGVEVVEVDATQLELPTERFVVVANLPFARTSDLLHHLLDDPRSWLRRADVVVEWAVAHRLAVPWPSSLKGVLWSAHYTIVLARRLPRGAFVPAPAVDAGVLVFERRSRPLVAAADVPAYHRFVAAGFRHGLGAVVSRRELDRLGSDASTARELDARQWATLFEWRPSDRAGKKRSPSS